MKVQGRVWQHRETFDWYWVEEKDGCYFGALITCVQASHILANLANPPDTKEEISNPGEYEPVTEKDVFSCFPPPKRTRI
jgi:hypothetical protein